jgi:hypothetical protein
MVRVDPEQIRDAGLRHGKPLARRVDRQRVAVPCRHDGVGLHGIVILRRGLVGLIDAQRRGGKTRFDIADARRGRADEPDCSWDEALGRIETGTGRPGVVVGRQ